MFGAAHTLTQEMMILFAALAALLVGIVMLAVDVVRRNQRRIDAESRPIDTSLFKQFAALSPPVPPDEAAAPAAAEEETPVIDAEHLAPAPRDTEILESEVLASEVLELEVLEPETREPEAQYIEAQGIEAHDIEAQDNEQDAEQDAPLSPAPVLEDMPLSEPIAADDMDEMAVTEPMAFEASPPAAQAEPGDMTSAASGDMIQDSVTAKPEMEEALPAGDAAPEVPESSLPAPAEPEAESAAAPEPEPTALDELHPVEAAVESPMTDEPPAELPEPLSEPALEPIAAFTPAEPAPPPAPITARPVLVCTGFGAGFGSKVVLADVTLEIPNQGITTLMGPVGTGKSTLLRALAGTLNLSGLFKSWGQASYRGAPVGPDNRPLLVAQRIQLIQRSALDNLLFHLSRQTAGMPLEKQRNWASQWLTQAGAAYIIPLLDRPFMELGQLEQRIITILREAAAEPALLMIDEPTTGLAEADAAVLLAILEGLASFTPLLVVLQNHKHARKISSQIILLAGGQVQASCDTDDFFDNNSPNQAVAQFIATGSCAVPVAAPDAAAPKPADPSLPPPLTDAALEAIKDEIRSALAAEMAPAPAAPTPIPAPEAWLPEPPAPDMELAADAPDAAPEMADQVLPEPEPEPLAFAPEPALSEIEAFEPEPEPSMTGPASTAPTPEPEILPLELEEADEEPELLLRLSASTQMVPFTHVQQRPGSVPTAPDPAAEQQRNEHAAVTRYPGGGGTGPRGFLWIEDGRLAATPMPGISAAMENDLELLKNAGITVLITLTEQDVPQNMLARHGLRNVHFPIADRKAPSTAETDVLVSQMHDMLDRGEVLAVHCLAGLGRTGTILAAYMVKEKGVSAQVALNQIRRFNRQFVQTDDQEDFLMEYEVQQEQTDLRIRATGGFKLLPGS